MTHHYKIKRQKGISSNIILIFFPTPIIGENSNLKEVMTLIQCNTMSTFYL